MRIPGLGLMGRTLRRLHNMLVPTALILLYHRVGDVMSDPHGLCVTPSNFREHLEVLRKNYCLMPLNQLVRAFSTGNLPRRAVAITFDDGYEDNLYTAKPFLERYNIPATFFITTGCIGKNREFWWDELEKIFLQPGQLPETLKLHVNKIHYNWELGATAYYSKDNFYSHRGWNIEQENDPSTRHTIYRKLCQAIRPLPEEDRITALSEIIKWAGKDITSRSTHRTLFPEKLLKLAEGSLIDIGCHTVAHSVLSSIPTNLQETEILQSKRYLEKLLNKTVTSFSYPHGMKSDYTSETIKIIKNAGFKCACAAFSNVVKKSTKPFELPRVFVPNITGKKFKMRLRTWFLG